jgi:hypothetical protein
MFAVRAMIGGDMEDQRSGAPVLMKVLAALLGLVSLFAFFGSLFMWGEGFLFSSPEGADYRYPIVDILINAPASMIAAIGLWRLKRYGFVAAQFVAGFYIYASVEIFIEVIQAGAPYPIEIIAPQVVAVALAVALLTYLWRVRDLFGWSNQRPRCDRHVLCMRPNE